MFVWFDGELREEAQLSVTDPAVQFGEGVFTTVRIEEGQPIWLDQHLKRLRRHCRELSLPYVDCAAGIYPLIDACSAQSGLWRLKIVHTRHHHWMTLAPYQLPKAPLQVGIYPHPIFSPHAHLKTLAYLPRLAIRSWAQERQLDDAVVTLSDGILVESACANLLWEVDGEWFTPDGSKLPLFDGLYVTHLAQSHTVHRVLATLDAIPRHARVYLCNCMQGAFPVAQLGSRSFSDVLADPNDGGQSDQCGKGVGQQREALR